ncbi:putative membrane-associated trancriptional regulator [Natranaeroarchaeum sulfidigenes]|uniref:Putative membrane-associated trancriptional regulator n=1 Tax=Natranaeroarchaeum sulfidigenes TaxID=2784880 RepID=A0A897MUN4_9EURY|nr:putative membrane-associated trancriptional regulator [Natranaeroarchaeum sulfidigenes]
MGLALCIAVGIVAVLTMVGVAGAVDGGSHSLQEAGPESPTAQESFDADDARLTVTVDSDGTATWTVEYWKRLDDDESEEAFASIESDVEENPEEYVDGFAESMNDTVASAADDTDREMSASGYTVSTRTESIPQEYGVLTYQFEWSGFAAVDGDRMEIGDAISGFYLDDQTRLVIGWPGEYGLVDVRPEPNETRSDSVLWRGSETTFVGDEPRVVVSTEPDDADGLDDGTVDGEDSSGIPLIPVGGGVTGVFLLFMLWWLYSRGLSDEGAEDGDTVAQDRDGTQTAAVAGGVSTGGDEASTDLSGEAIDESDSGPPSELLSNEERVVRLLEQHDGRLKQQQVVQELDWTDAKTSQVISDLREEGTVETFRIGRENVVRLPEVDGEDTI